MATYIITGAAGTGKSLLAKRIAMSYPICDYMSPGHNVFEGTYRTWTPNIDCIVVEALTTDDTALCDTLLKSIKTGQIPGLRDGCSLVLVFQDLPEQMKGLKNVFYVHMERTTESLSID